MFIITLTGINMFREIRLHIPSLSPRMESYYGIWPILYFGEHTILSRCEVQQDDPLGHLHFALTLQLIVERIKRVVPDLPINVWYLDDGTVMSKRCNLLHALKIVEEEGPAYGLNLNKSKSLLSIPPSTNFPTISPSPGMASAYWAPLWIQQTSESP